MKYLIYSKRFIGGPLKKETVKTFASSFRGREEGAERIMTTHPRNCCRIKPVFQEWMVFLMQLGFLPLDSGIATFCHRVDGPYGLLSSFRVVSLKAAVLTGEGRRGLGWGECIFQS